MNPITSAQNDQRHTAAVDELQYIADRTRAAELLARQPHYRLPLMSWVVEDGTLAGQPPTHADPAEARQACDAWRARLGLVPEIEAHCGGAPRATSTGSESPY
jgi:hypothetical protein